MNEKETVVRTVLFSHIMQDDQDTLKGTEFFSQDVRYFAGKLLKASDKKYKRIQPVLWRDEANVKTTEEVWNAIDRICVFVSKLDLTSLITYADSLDELTSEK
jgi:hypothetical protein